MTLIIFNRRGQWSKEAEQSGKMRTKKQGQDTVAWRWARTLVRVVSTKARWQGAEGRVGGEYILFKPATKKSELRALASL